MTKVNYAKKYNIDKKIIQKNNKQNCLKWKKETSNR